MKSFMLESRLAAVAMFCTILLATGCVSQPKKVYVPEFYKVKQGESLSSIAAKYQLNYMDIARLNNIEKIDKIYPNQSLRLRRTGSTPTRVIPTKPLYAVDTRRDQVSQQNVRPVAPLIQDQANQIGLSHRNLTGVSQNWTLPSHGPVIAHFDVSKDKKGIFFGGRSGDPIYAAREGEVIYADSGLPEYGRLLLVRHGDGYITAYAHNQQLIAKVGDRVNAGQKIAEMGSTGTAYTMLQFQIRLDGKPIDPAKILPLN